MAKVNNVLRKIEPYWYAVIFYFIYMGSVYIRHLLTGEPPNRIAFTFFGFFSFYWYGVVIAAGVAVGTYTGTRLARERAVRLLNQHVPVTLTAKPLIELENAPDIQARLRDAKIKTTGDLLLAWGFGQDFRLDAATKDDLRQRLASLLEREGSDPTCLDDAPWRIWNPDYGWGMLIFCIVFAIIGARIYHVLTPSPSMAETGITGPLDYLQDIQRLVAIRSGGLGIYGGMVGGVLAALWYTRRKQIPFLGWLDLAAVAVSIGMAFGRWGNFFNQELYGKPTELPFGVLIDVQHRLADVAQYGRFHPAFLYESLWNLLAFFVLVMLARRYYGRFKDGDLVALFLICYAIGRIGTEMVRLNSRTAMIWGWELPIATLVSAGIVLIMIVWIIVKRLPAFSIPKPSVDTGM